MEADTVSQLEGGAGNDKRSDDQYVVAYAKLENGVFQGSLFVNARHPWRMEQETAKDVIQRTRWAVARAERFYS